MGKILPYLSFCTLHLKPFPLKHSYDHWDDGPHISYYKAVHVHNKDIDEGSDEDNHDPTFIGQQHGILDVSCINIIHS